MSTPSLLRSCARLSTCTSRRNLWMEGSFSLSKSVLFCSRSRSFLLGLSSQTMCWVILCSQNGNFVLELDFEPFTATFPKPTLSKSIGNGVEFLNRHLSAKLFHDKESMQPLLDFLRVHCYKGKVCLQFSIFSF